jgi:hypothetical protein
VTYTINSNGQSNINARVTWSAYYKNIAVSLLGPSGQSVAVPQKQSDGFTSAFEQVSYTPSVSGPYTLKLEAGGLRDSIAYTLITPYQV